jgi:alpha-tubulin suppressor-like RCC1 family protein
VIVVGGITTWSQVSAGQSFSLGITSAGVAYGWGYNGYGGLGDNTATGKSSPVTVVGGLTWSKVSAGYIHSLGITSAGVAYGWGNNGSGRLGDGTTTSRSSPVSVVGGLNWSQVSAGVQHSVGLTTSGVAYGWGYNAVGAVGDTTQDNRLSPVTVVGGLTWSQVTAGGAHSLGITSSGVAYAWGRNHQTQLGDSTSTNRLSPVSVVGGITTWSQLSGSPSGNSGYNHSLGIAAGVAYAWGSGNEARLGDGSQSGTVSSPVTVLGGITNWSQIKAGGRHSLGLTSTGIAYAWGNNQDGQGANNVDVRSVSPVVISGGLIGWSQISAGINHSLAIYAYGS